MIYSLYITEMRLSQRREMDLPIYWRFTGRKAINASGDDYRDDASDIIYMPNEYFQSGKWEWGSHLDMEDELVSCLRGLR